MNPAPIGVPGELCIGGPGVADEYHRRPELSRERFVDDPFSGGRLYKSGDLASFRADGVLLHHGRADDQVKIRGHRIEPGEIAALLELDPSVERAVVVARGEPTRLIAYVQPRNGHSPDIGRLKEFLKAQLPDYMVPAQLVELARLPLTGTGKVDRNSLPAPDSFRAMNAYVAPRSEPEARVRAVWAEFLGIGAGEIGIHDEFLSLGGDSIVAIQILSRLRQTLGVQISVSEIFAHNTIHEGPRGCRYRRAVGPR